jgi:acyl carrier protein
MSRHRGDLAHVCGESLGVAGWTEHARGNGRNMMAIERLCELPPAERRAGLEDLVVAEFRTTLMMADDEDLPFDMSYFELGFTSLGITEIKERLETQLGRSVSTNVLFNSPTMERLIAYLADEVLTDVFGPMPLPAD